MKLTVGLLLIASFSAASAEECIFNENAFPDFRAEYARTHDNARVDADKDVLIIEKGNELIEVRGGGCVHLGVSVTSRSDQRYTQESFLQKVVNLTVEFGAWLINTDKLEQSVRLGRWEKHGAEYFILVDEMTVFAASFDDKGTVHVDFYIN